jgi:hypothetical protein
VIIYGYWLKNIIHGDASSDCIRLLFMLANMNNKSVSSVILDLIFLHGMFGLCAIKVLICVLFLLEAPLFGAPLLENNYCQTQHFDILSGPEPCSKATRLRLGIGF